MDESPGWYLLVASAASIAVVGVLALATHQPFVFPSLGPTAYIVFATPLALAACPRSVLGGHLVGVLAGVVGLLAFGLWGVAPDLEDVTWARVGAVTVALALTLSVMTWLGVAHAPAGATTLIVALGLLDTVGDLVVMMAAVLVLVVVAAVINRVFGTATPWWGAPPGGVGKVS
ncbi:MAG: HPP family protein [Candidatus Nanopelagicales bacterium]